MNQIQKQRLEETPVMYRGGLKRAFEVKCSPRMAIKAFCLQCVGEKRVDITNCTATGCALWGYRPFKNGVDDDDSDVVNSTEASKLAS